MRNKVWKRTSLAATAGLMGLLAVQVLWPTDPPPGVPIRPAQAALDQPHARLDYTGVARRMDQRNPLVIAAASTVRSPSDCLQIMRSDGRIARLCR